MGCWWTGRWGRTHGQRCTSPPAPTSPSSRPPAAARTAGITRHTTTIVTAIITGPTTPPSSLGARAVALAKRELGVRYVYGGESPSGFDCSGLMQYVYARLGVPIPRVAADQYRAGRHVSRADLRPGDLVFFDHLGHVGMYVGGGRFIHAPHTGTVVEISSLSGWYSEMYVGATRVS